MELLFDPGNGNDKGKLMPVPAGMKKFLYPWAVSFYCEYPFGYSLVQQFHAKKFGIYSWKIYADAQGRLYPSSELPVIAIQAMIEGEIPCSLSGFGEMTLKRSTYELLYIPVSINEAILEPGNYESFHVELEPGFLENIADTYPAARELLQRFNNASEKGIPLMAVTLNYIARSIIENIKSSDKTGGDLVIMMHRYIVDLLSEYMSGIRQEERDNRQPNIRHKGVLLEIKREILSDPNIQDQEIGKLSLRYGIGITELKKEFKIFFGETPAAFIRFHALTKSQFLLATTDDTIERIAYEIGYGHRSNFDKAFKKQFGYLPANLR